MKFIDVNLKSSHLKRYILIAFYYNILGCLKKKKFGLDMVIFMLDLKI